MLAAGELYPGLPRVAGTGLLCREEWLPGEPVGLDRAELAWRGQVRPPAVTGAGAESLAVRPLAAAGERFSSYAAALGSLDRPALFEDRFLYRLLGADLSSPGSARLELAGGRYFSTISVNEAVAHELAAALISGDGVPDLDELPLRSAVGDPRDLTRRPAGVAITTLTVRRERSGRATFWLHWRDPAKVTHAGGMYQVMPVGIFQPADDNPASIEHDLSLWRGMVREFSEELLGEGEDYGRLGSPVAYEQWPFFRQLDQARQEGRLRVRILGLGVDPLSLACDLLTVAEFDASVFDELFGELVTVNAEGKVVGGGAAAGFDLSAETVDRLTSSGADGRMQQAGAAILRLACSSSVNNAF